VVVDSIFAPTGRNAFDYAEAVITLWLTGILFAGATRFFLNTARKNPTEEINLAVDLGELWQLCQGGC
jgi:hypothetical protein